MKVILDECLPRKLAALLTGHDVTTAPRAGLAGKSNGELLRLINGQFDGFVTIDKNLAHEQDISKFSIRVIGVEAKSNRLNDIRPLVPKLLQALLTTAPGNFTVVRAT